MRIGYNRDAADDFGKKYGVIILSGGLSSRMKAFKPLLYVDAMPAIEGLIESAKVAGVNDIIVVTGHNREALRETIEKSRTLEIVNERYKEGMFTSIQAGLAGAKENFGDKEGYLLMPVDCPLISVRVMRELMEGAGTKTADGFAEFAVPTFEGKKGHPLFIPAEYVDEIIEYEGPGGLKAITDKYWNRMKRIPVDEEGCILDMDTPEGYEDIRNFVAKGFRREKLELLTARKRIILIRHGETEQHDEPMFIGQYDVPLSDLGRQQAAATAELVADAIAEDVEAEALGMDKFGKEPLPAIERIYSSDLGRAVETAEIIRDCINKRYAKQGIAVDIQKDEGLREINLGSWDGKPVSEIKNNHAEEYRRRGEDMFVFKTGNHSENFYDMQYRVLAAFREILRNDDAKDIIVITHSGVIRALENNINGLRVDDDWEKVPKGGFRVLTPFPDGDKIVRKEDESNPMSMENMTLEAALEYYE